MLPHWDNDLLSHSVTLSWHWANQSSPYPNNAERQAHERQVSILMSLVWLNQGSNLQGLDSNHQGSDSPIFHHAKRTLYSLTRLVLKKRILTDWWQSLTGDNSWAPMFTAATSAVIICSWHFVIVYSQLLVMVRNLQKKKSNTREPYKTNAFCWNILNTLIQIDFIGLTEAKLLRFMY